MKIMTVLGTRPEIIRLSRVIEKLDRLADKHILVHTGQNFDPALSDIFFEQLRVRAPDHYLGARGENFGDQIAQILALSTRLLLQERPDRLLILGDTNSALVAIVAKRMGIPVYHMEAGNRCYDDRVPEEVNRRIIDHSSDVLMPYTERSRMNLLREGFAGQRVFVTGNPINEVLLHYEREIDASDIFGKVDVTKGKYFLVTMHRQENVDDEVRLRGFLDGFDRLVRDYDMPIICSTHPRTRARFEGFGIDSRVSGKIRFHEPFGLFDFVALEKNAFCVLSDSGTVQEECCIFKVANVTIRDVTERPETVECGSNMLSGGDPATMMRCVKTVLDNKATWYVPPEYTVANVSNTVARLVLGYR